MSFLKQIHALAKPYWSSQERKKAALYLSLILALVFGNVYIQVLLNNWRNAFYTALQEYNAPEIMTQLGIFTALAFTYIIIAVYSFYITQLLSLKWRRWMTHHYIDNWVEGKKYYYLQMFYKHTDNPDQRISEDIKLFIDYFLKFTVGLTNNLLLFISFVAILWGLSGPLQFSLGGIAITIPRYIVWVAIFYSILGTYVTHKLGYKLVGFRYVQQKYEANFRFSLIRLREHAQSVAFYGGEKEESLLLRDRFQSLLENFYRIIKKEKQLVWLNSSYSQLAIIFPIVVSIPQYLGRTLNLGGLMQTAAAFRQVQDSLSYFVDLYTSFAEWRAVVNRLTEFNDHLFLCETTETEATLNLREGEWFEADHLSLTLPSGEVLVENLSLRILPGHHLLIQGPNGAGKSTLLKAFAGLWPYVKGSLIIPKREDILFIPQQAYMPIQTLRHVLSYPKQVTASDEELQLLLNTVGLSHLKTKLDHEADWSQFLSLGEQQRLAFARILWQKPKWLILDEATSAMDEETEQRLMQEIKKALPHTTLISIGHRHTLEAYHSSILYINKAQASIRLYSATTS